MSEDDLKSILAAYQKKSFELFNSNIVMETQINSLRNAVNALTEELEKLKKPKRGAKVEDDFT